MKKVWINIVFLLVLSSSVFAAVCPDGIVAYWKLDDTGMTFDDFMDNYDGSCSSGTCPFATTGKVEGAQSFSNSENDYITAGDIIELNSVSEFTILGWYADNNIGGHNRHFDKGDGWGEDISAATYGGSLYLEVGNGANSYAYWTGYSSAISAGEWYHATFVFDGLGATNPDKAKIFVNSVQRTLSFGGSMPTTTANLVGYPFTLSKITNNQWDGKIDEVAIFSRALSQSEIETLYNRGVNGLGLCKECGNGEVEPDNSEECDDGNNNDDDGCNSQCVIEFCGDSIIQPGLGEECEFDIDCNDDNDNTIDTCNACLCEHEEIPPTPVPIMSNTLFGLLAITLIGLGILKRKG